MSNGLRNAIRGVVLLAAASLLGVPFAAVAQSTGAVSTSYPSEIRAGAGFKVQKQGLSLRISADYSNVPLMTTTPAAGNVLVQDPATGEFNRLDLSNLPTTVPRDASVTLQKFSAIPALTFIGNATGATAQPQYLAPSQAKTALSLDQVNNTSDADKPLSAAQAAALSAKAPVASPTFTGTATVPKITLTGPDSTGDVSKMSAAPNLTAPEGTLAKAFGDISGFKAPGATGTARLDAAYNIINSRSLFNSPPSGQPTDWLGNGAGGSASQYAYGGLAQGLFLSGIGDVGLVGAVRTEDIATSGRLPIGNMGWCFNFKTTSPQTCWGGYMEARRKVGAGQIHTLELNATELGNGSDRIIPSAMKNGPNAIYSAYASVLNLASGGNVRPGQQTGWDGTTNVTQAADIGSYLSLYSNGARAEKAILISEDAVVGCDGTGGSKTCVGVEMGRGTDIRWIDGTTRHGSLINSDVSSSGNVQRLRFTDFGTIIDGNGGATLNVIAKSTDVNGVQVVGGGSAAAPARVVASGSPNASLGLSASGGGIVQMQSVMQLAAYTVATLPACDAARIGGMAYVTDATTVAYRNGLGAGGGSLKAPVFCTGSAWEYH